MAQTSRSQKFTLFAHAVNLALPAPTAKGLRHSLTEKDLFAPRLQGLFDFVRGIAIAECQSIDHSTICVASTPEFQDAIAIRVLDSQGRVTEGKGAL